MPNLRFGGGGEKCSACQRTVYCAEKQVIDDRPYHMECFVCTVCHKKLSNTNYCKDESGTFFCKAHFMQALSASGGKYTGLSQTHSVPDSLETKQIRDEEAMQCQVDTKLAEVNPVDEVTAAEPSVHADGMESPPELQWSRWSVGGTAIDAYDDFDPGTWQRAEGSASNSTCEAIAKTEPSALEKTISESKTTIAEDKRFVSREGAPTAFRDYQWNELTSRERQEGNTVVSATAETMGAAVRRLSYTTQAMQDELVSDEADLSGSDDDDDEEEGDALSAASTQECDDMAAGVVASLPYPGSAPAPPSLPSSWASAPKSSRLQPQRRSATAAEGVALLQGRCEVTKFSRGGKASTALLRLSDDERSLKWQKPTKFKRLKAAAKRSIQVSEIAVIMVGRESDAFRLAGAGTAQGAAHLSLSLVLAPTDSGERERDTFDLCCGDEEQFGLLVAALRALVAEEGWAQDEALRIAEALEREKDKPWGGQGPPIITTGSHR